MASTWIQQQEQALMSVKQRGMLNWWQGLILAASSAIVGVVASIFIMNPGSGMGTGPSALMMLLRFVPHFLMLFGLLADAFTYEGVYWTGTMTGVAATVVAPFLDKVATGLMSVPGLLMKKTSPTPVAPLAATAVQSGGEYLGCSLVGDGTAGTVPQTLTVTTSILSYYIFDLAFNRSVLDAAGAIAAAAALFGGQLMAISGCLGGKTGSAALFAGIYGLIVGGGMYTIIATWGPRYLPSSVLNGSGGGGPGGGGGRNGGPGNLGTGGAAQGSGNPAQKATCPA